LSAFFGRVFPLDLSSLCGLYSSKQSIRPFVHQQLNIVAFPNQVSRFCYDELGKISELNIRSALPRIATLPWLIMALAVPSRGARCIRVYIFPWRDHRDVPHSRTPSWKKHSPAEIIDRRESDIRSKIKTAEVNSRYGRRGQRRRPTTG